MNETAKSASGRILHNSFWYGLETILETVIFFGTSVAVARFLGPAKMGYFSYINFFVQTVTRTSGTGLASATRKYMSEFLALDQPGVARAVYRLAWRYQLLGALAITVLGVASILLFGDPRFRVMSCILMLGITPGVMSWVPAQANNAFEDVKNNTQSAFGYLVTYALIILLTLIFHWDLVGIASATLIARSVEVVLRTIPLNRKLASIPLEPIPADVTSRIRRFCVQAFFLQLLMSVVWDRSEFIFLKFFCTLEQIGFYSVSFGLANNLLLIPRTFGAATGITLMVEASRAPARVAGIVNNACRYLLLVALPVHLGAAAITRSAIGVVYGPRYALAVPVLIVAAILAIPRAFQEIGEVLMRTADRQKQMLVWLTITGVLNIALDWMLIKHYGPVGAACANGLAQTFGVLAVWQQARRFYTFRFPLKTALRFLAASGAMSAVAYFLSHRLPGLPGLVMAVLAAIPLYVLLVKLLHGLEATDLERLALVGDRLPGRVRGLYLAAIAFAIPKNHAHDAADALP